MSEGSQPICASTIAQQNEALRKQSRATRRTVPAENFDVGLMVPDYKWGSHEQKGAPRTGNDISTSIAARSAVALDACD